MCLCVAGRRIMLQCLTKNIEMWNVWFLGFYFIYLFICLSPDTKFIVQTHRLCRMQVDKNRQNRTFSKALEPMESQGYWHFLQLHWSSVWNWKLYFESWRVYTTRQNTIDWRIACNKAGVGNLLLVTGQMSSVQLFGGPVFSLIL